MGQRFPGVPYDAHLLKVQQVRRERTRILGHSIRHALNCFPGTRNSLSVRH